MVAGETYKIFFRDVLDCLRALFGEPEFVPHLVFLPERHYADSDHTVRLFHDMHTGKWWWAAQVRLETVLSRLHIPCADVLCIEGSGVTNSWCDHYACDYIVR